MVDLQDITQIAETSLRELQTRSNPEGEGENKGWIASETMSPRNDGGLFLVEVKQRGDEFEVSIEADGVAEDGRSRRVTVDDCVALTKAIESRFDRDEPENDFSLTVSSAGIGQPLRVPRQYRKLVGRPVEVVLAGGAKITGALVNYELANEAGADGSITLSYPEKQKIEGKKRPEIVTVTRTFPLAEVKTTVEHIDFK